MRDQTRLFAILGLACVAGAAVAGNPTLILDDFDADPNDDAGGPRVLSTSILGDPFGQGSNFDVDTDLMIDGDQGAAIFNSGIGVAQEGTIRWDNGGAGLSLDAGALGIIGFELDFAAIDQDFSYIFRLTDGNGETLGASGDFLAGGARTESIALASFESSAAFDVSDVDAVEIIFNVRGQTESLDFALTEFRAVVPTPGSAVLIGVGGLLAMRRRR
ncbi:MAG: hypothetical protein AAGA55_01730 [Planctomycetota bacterium]